MFYLKVQDLIIQYHGRDLCMEELDLSNPAYFIVSTTSYGVFLPSCILYYIVFNELFLFEYILIYHSKFFEILGRLSCASRLQYFKTHQVGGFPTKCHLEY